MMNNFQLTYSNHTKLFDELKVIAAQQNYKESRHDRSFGNSTINEQFEKVGILSLSLDLDKKFKDDRKAIYYGLEFVNNDIRSVAQTRNIVNGQIAPAGSRYPNGDNAYTSFSFYTGYKYNYSGKFTFNSGLRYNHVSLNYTISDNSYYNFPFNEISISNGALTGSVGMVFRIDEKTQVNVNTSTGFRAPNLDDAGKVFDSAPGVVVVPNPGLKPEYVYNIDIGASRDLGKIFHLEMTAFYSWLNNAMIRHDFQFNGQDSMLYLGEMSKVEAVTNRGSARVYGLHFNLQANITDHLKVKSSLNLTEGREESGDPLRHAAPLFGSTHLVFTIPKLTADLYSNYNGARKFKDMAPSEIDKAYLYASDDNGNPWSPGWATMNLKLSYDILKRVSANAGIENILNTQYRPYSSGIVSPGRNIILSVRIKI
jgi:hemoglobin/transferrin/lactoferrin receptor protein